MQQVTIDRFRVVPAPLTGIGWVAVQVWDEEIGEYRHVTTCRTKDEADVYISNNSDK